MDFNATAPTMDFNATLSTTDFNATSPTMLEFGYTDASDNFRKFEKKDVVIRGRNKTIDLSGDPYLRIQVFGKKNWLHKNTQKKRLTIYFVK